MADRLPSEQNSRLTGQWNRSFVTAHGHTIRSVAYNGWGWIDDSQKIAEVCFDISEDGVCSPRELRTLLRCVRSHIGGDIDACIDLMRQLRPDIRADVFDSFHAEVLAAAILGGVASLLQ